MGGSEAETIRQPRDRLTGFAEEVSIAPPSSAGPETTAPGEGAEAATGIDAEWRRRRLRLREPAAEGGSQGTNGRFESRKDVERSDSVLYSRQKS